MSIDTVGVAGVGTMGSGIAYVFAFGGKAVSRFEEWGKVLQVCEE